MLLQFFSVWKVTGGKYGLTCPAPENATLSEEFQLCKNLSIPDCSDRTIYCTNPPTSLTSGTVTIKTNPSTNYKKSPGDIGNT